jgi:hypothetical protein
MRCTPPMSPAPTAPDADRAEQPAVAMTRDGLARGRGVGCTGVRRVCNELPDANLISYGGDVISQRIDHLPQPIEEPPGSG